MFSCVIRSTQKIAVHFLSSKVASPPILTPGGYQGHYHYFAAFTPYQLAFPSFVAPYKTPISVFFAPYLNVSRDRARSAEFSAFQARLQRAASPAGVEPGRRSHSHFYDSDYTVSE